MGDGILGITGEWYDRGRSNRAEPGNPRIIGDAKLFSPVDIEGAYALALLDSGASTAALSPVKLKELFPDKPIADMRLPVMGAGDDGPTSISFAPGVNVELLGKRYEKLAVVGLDALDDLLSPILGVQTQLLIGMPQMREMKSLTVDFPRARMWVEWLEGSK